ncbi:MAG: hypothetical protein JWO36_6715, partial [Myxococcales bacterium]|nr:hypothetical protein [Myxococcales bacterium]
MMRTWIALFVCIAACSSGSADDGRKKPRDMHADSRFDFLLSPEGTHELYEAHRHDTPDQVALIRAALNEDARVRVRVNAIVALSASQKQHAMP